MRFFIADETNIDDLINMRVEYVRAESGSLDPEDEAYMRKVLPSYYENHLNKDFIGFFAECDGEVIGSACLHIIERPCRPEYRSGKIGEVLNVLTLKAYRRRGIASELMKMLITYAQKENLSIIHLEATKEGRAVYEKLGFRESDLPYTGMQYVRKH